MPRMVKPRILLVDDDVNLCRLVQMTLERTERFEVRAESLPFVALKVAREFQPDLLLLDVDMPGLDGGDLARELQSDPALRNVPVLFLTALVPKHEAGMRHVVRGGMRFLAKPAEPRVLVESIHIALNESGNARNHPAQPKLAAVL